MGQNADYEAHRYDWANNPTDQWGGPAHNQDGSPSTQFRVPGTNVPGSTGAGGKYGPTMQPDSYDPTSWGYSRGQADQDHARYTGMGEGFRNKAPELNYGSYDNYSNQADASRGLGMESRGRQLEAYGLMRDAAMGNTPSAAEIQQRRGMQDAMAGQLAIAAGARGASGIAQAGTSLGGNTAALQRQQASMGGQLRAEEMAHARDSMGGMATGIRGSDFQQRGQDFQAQGFGMQRAQAEADQRFRYGQRALDYDKMAWETRNAQMGSELSRRGLDDSRVSARMSHDFQKDQANKADARGYAGAVASMGTGAMQASTASDKKKDEDEDA